MEREPQQSTVTRKRNGWRRRAAAGLAATALIVGTSDGTASAEKKSNPNCNQTDTQICYWKVRSVKPLSGVHRHKWNNCARVQRSELDQTVTCSIANSNSRTISADVGGTVKVPFVDMSAKVGYTVNETTTVTVSDAVPVTAGKGTAVIQWAGVFANRKLVTQENQPCSASYPPYTYNDCTPQPHPAADDIARATAEKFDSTIYRVILLHPHGSHK